MHGMPLSFLTRLADCSKMPGLEWLLSIPRLPFEQVPTILSSVPCDPSSSVILRLCMTSFAFTPALPPWVLTLCSCACCNTPSYTVIDMFAHSHRKSPTYKAYKPAYTRTNTPHPRTHMYRLPRLEYTLSLRYTLLRSWCMSGCGTWIGTSASF